MCKDYSRNLEASTSKLVAQACGAILVPLIRHFQAKRKIRLSDGFTFGVKVLTDLYMSPGLGKAHKPTNESSKRRPIKAGCYRVSMPCSAHGTEVSSLA